MRALLIATIVLLLVGVVAASSNSDASQYHDCDSCVEAGWGWSWSKGQCGGFLNTNCDPDSADALDEEEDEDFAMPTPTTGSQQQDTQASSSSSRSIPAPAPIPSEPVAWENTPDTTRLWELCHKGDLQSLTSWVYSQPTIVHLRSEDGRGALFWANEYDKDEMIKFLIERGADPEATDANGMKPEDLRP